MILWTCSVAAIWTHPSELNINLTKKEKNTNDMKHSLASDSVGTQVLLALHWVYGEKSRRAVWVHSKCWQKGPKAHFALQDMAINPLRKWHGLHYKKIIRHIRHCTHTTCSHFSKLQSTDTNSCLPLTANICPFYHHLIVPSSPSPAIACCVYLHACWMCILMAIGMNDCRYNVAFLRGIINLSLVCAYNQIQIWVVVSHQPKLSLVCSSLVEDELCIRFLAFSHSPHAQYNKGFGKNQGKILTSSWHLFELRHAAQTLPDRPC